MAINPNSLYPGKTKAPDADYPYGSARNVTTPGDGTGTPWEAALVNDLFGFQQELLDSASIVPSGTPERVGASQYAAALRRLFQSNGITEKDVAGAVDVTLTEAEVAAGVLVFTGEITASIDVVVPDRARQWLVRNETTGGGFTLTVKTAAGTGVTIERSRTYGLRSDGINVVSFLGSAAERDVQASATDQTAGRLLAVDAFGLGAAAVDPVADLNNLAVTGLFRFKNSPANSPPVGTGAWFDVLATGNVDSRYSQWATEYAADNSIRIFFRNNSNGTWSAWTQIVTNGSAGTGTPQVVTAGSLNLINNPQFRDGWPGWGAGGNTDPAIYIRPENEYAGGGMRISVIAASVQGSVAPSFVKNVNPRKKYRLEVRGNVNNVPSGSQSVQILVTAASFGGSVSTILSNNITSSGDFIYTAIINEFGGAAPAWDDSLSMQAEVVCLVNGDSGVAPEFRLRVSSVSLQPQDSCFIEPSAIVADGDQTGSHEGQRVGDDLFVVVHGYNRIAKFDKTLTRVAVSNSLNNATGQRPHDITYDGTSLWVVCQTGETINKLNVSTLAEEASYPITGGRQGFGITYDSVSGQLYVGAGNEGAGETTAVIAVNPSNGAQTVLSTDVACTGNNQPVEVADGSIWSTDGNTNEVKRINKGTGATEATIPVGEFVGKVYGLGTNGTALVVCGAIGVAQIDTSTNTVLRSWELGYLAGAANVFVDESGIAYAAGLAMNTNDGASAPIVTDHQRGADWKWCHKVTDTKLVHGGILSNWLGYFDVTN